VSGRTPPVRVLLVRHGHAAAGWTEDSDPGLDALGREQARAIAEALGPCGPMSLICSPMRRARETAAALEALWGNKVLVEEAVSEVPSPVEGLRERGTWLREALRGSWASLERDQGLRRWRAELLHALGAIERDTVVVTHFVAINAAVGAAVGDDRVVVFRPDNCSRTTLEVDDGRLTLVELGVEVEAVSEVG